MANPQPDRFTRISNEILESLCKIRISGEANQILNVIFRQTYGFNQRGAMITLDKFAAMTGLKKPNIVRAIKKLYQMNLIIKKDNGKYAFQKDFDRWKPLSKKITIIKIDNNRCQIRQRKLSKVIISTDEPKDTSKDIYKDIGDDKRKREETPTQKIIKAYRIKKYPTVTTEETIKEWNASNYGRCLPYAGNLLALFKNYKMVVICIDVLGSRFQKAGFKTWSLAAIDRNAYDWKLERENKTND